MKKYPKVIVTTDGDILILRRKYLFKKIYILVGNVTYEGNVVFRHSTGEMRLSTSDYLEVSEAVFKYLRSRQEV